MSCSLFYELRFFYELQFVLWVAVCFMSCGLFNELRFVLWVAVCFMSCSLFHEFAVCFMSCSLFHEFVVCWGVAVCFMSRCFALERVLHSRAGCKLLDSGCWHPTWRSFVRSSQPTTFLCWSCFALFCCAHPLDVDRTGPHLESLCFQGYLFGAHGQTPEWIEY